MASRSAVHYLKPLMVLIERAVDTRRSVRAGTTLAATLT
jgi:hypothetical protein